MTKQLIKIAENLHSAMFVMLGIEPGAIDIPVWVKSEWHWQLSDPNSSSTTSIIINDVLDTNDGRLNGMYYEINDESEIMPDLIIRTGEVVAMLVSTSHHTSHSPILLILSADKEIK
jgi:hypothetical protein